MKTFTIDNETNAITFHASAADVDAFANAEQFGSEKTLAKLAAEWPTARLVEIWNSLPGQTPVKKFKDRNTAVSRIWKAIQSLATLDTPAATQTPDVAPEAAPAKKGATRAKKAPAAAKKAPAAKKTAAAKPATDASAPREGSKASQVIAMLQRKGGTTIEEIMTKMGWQVHTTRALLSAGGSLTKKHGLIVTSEKVGDKRIYSIKG